MSSGDTKLENFKQPAVDQGYIEDRGMKPLVLHDPDPGAAFDAVLRRSETRLLQRVRELLDEYVEKIIERIPYAGATGFGLGPKSPYEARMKFEQSRRETDEEYNARMKDIAEGIEDGDKTDWPEAPMSNAQARALDQAHYGGKS